MATITTKYSVGDKVFFASTHTIQKKHDCPDCKGARKWLVTSPAGREYSFSCPRCTSSYQSDRDMSLTYSQYAPRVTKYTIGSVRTDSGATYDRDPVSYMCVETGVGSGSIYYECDLFQTEQEALTAAQAKADEQNKTTPWLVELYNKTLELSDYQLSDAKGKGEELRDRTFRYRVEELVEALKEGKLSDEHQEAFDEFLGKVGWQ